MFMAPETVYGTPVATIRQFYGEGSFTESAGLNFHENENRSLRTRIARSPTATTEDVAVSFKTTQGISFDALVWFLNMFNGAAVGSGGGATKTWTQTPGMTSTLNAPKSFSADVGDDIQNWRLQGLQWQTIKLSSSRGGVTELEASGFAQRAVKTTASAPAINSAVKIQSDLWTLKQASAISGLAAASVIANLLLDFDLELTTGIVGRHYLDGNLYLAQAIEAKDITGTLGMTVESTAQAVSEFYDKAKAGTVSFLRFKNTTAAIGGVTYDSQIDLPVYYEMPEILNAEDDGVNTYHATAHVAYDSVSAKSAQFVTANSIATLV
jgi:hypothetical protein